MEVFSPKAVANHILLLAKQEGVDVSPMKLQKIVYYAHGWHLAIRKAPLLNTTVEAWQYGPVIPDLYHTFKEFGNSPIEGLASTYELAGTVLREINPTIPSVEVSSIRIIERVWELYKGWTAVELSTATHQPGTPWYEVWKKMEPKLKGTDIPNDLIQSHFEDQQKAA